MMLRVVLLFGLSCALASRIKTNNQVQLNQLLRELQRQREYGTGDYPEYFEPSPEDAMTRVRKGAGNCYAQGKCLYYSKRLKTEFCGNCGTRQKCFPENSIVQLEGGKRIQISELQIDDRVLAGSRCGEKVYSPVVAWLDRRVNSTAQYVRIGTQDGHQITMSSNHVLFVQQRSQLVSRFAGEIKVGDVVRTDGREGEFSWSAVDSVQAVISKGAFVPLTAEGTLMVDGVLASCYASFDHDWSHLFTSPLRWFPAYFTGLTDSDDGPRGSVEGLKQFGRWLFPETGSLARAAPDLTVIQLPMAEAMQLLLHKA